MAAYKAFNAVASAVSNAVNKPQGPPHWQTDLFACMDDTNVCLQTWCCIWCTESHIITMREKGVGELDPLTCCGSCCFDIILRGFFTAAFATAMRRELVFRYGITDEPYCNSAMMGACCAPCTLCQVQREMGMRQEHCGGFCAKAPEQQGNAATEALGKVSDAVSKVAGATGVAGAWGTDLFGFAGAMDCIDSWCCAPCTLAHMSNRIDAGRVALIPASTENKCEPLTCCGAWLCMPGFHFGMRRELVDKYGMAEPHLHSFCSMLFCPCCSLAQMRREMGARGEWPGGMLMKEQPQA